MPQQFFRGCLLAPTCQLAQLRSKLFERGLAFADQRGSQYLSMFRCRRTAMACGPQLKPRNQAFIQIADVQTFSHIASNLIPLGSMISIFAAGRNSAFPLTAHRLAPMSQSEAGITIGSYAEL